MIIPPPVFYLAGALAALALNLAWPMPAAPMPWRRIIAIACLLAAAVLLGSVLNRFRRAGTTFDPRSTASVLVLDGPFRFSRHPAYLALTAFYLGVGFLLDNGWFFPAGIPVVFVMNRWVMPAEEKRLCDKFGPAYASYMSRVRRWL